MIHSQQNVPFPETQLHSCYQSVDPHYTKIPPQKKDTSPCPILAKVICEVEFELSLPQPTKG
jgi:hypothetical protein